MTRQQWSTYVQSEPFELTCPEAAAGGGVRE
jgi:hypothetical protein